MLRQLAFASRARAGLRSSEISSVIAVSRSNNERDELTGVLLYGGETFIAIVEGRDAAVSALWRRMIIDDRHRGISSLFDITQRNRGFGDWRAGYVSEQQLAPLMVRWQSLAPSLPDGEADALRALCHSTPTF